MNISSLIRVLFTPIFFSVCVSSNAIGADGSKTRLLSPNPDEVAVAYAGFGYLSRTHQPLLASIVDGDDVKNTDGFGVELKRDEDAEKQWKELSGAIQSAIPKIKIPISNYQIALNEDSIKEIEKKLLIDFDAKDNKNLASLSIIGSLELMLDLSSKEIYNEHYFVIVSALLSIPGSGAIVATGVQAFDYSDVKRPSAAVIANPELNYRRQRENFRIAYQNAIPGALARLAKAAAAHGDAKAVTYSVANVAVQDETTRKVFAANPPKFASAADFCGRTKVCEDNNRACMAIEGLLAQGATEALSAAGKAVVPPLNWNAWAGANENGLLLRLAGGATAISNNMVIKLDHSQVDRKLLTVLSEFVEKDFNGSTQYLAERAYRAFVNFVSTDTDCDKELSIRNEKQVSANPIMQTIPANEKGKPSSSNLRKAYYMLSIYKTFVNGASDVKKIQD